MNPEEQLKELVKTGKRTSIYAGITLCVIAGALLWGCPEYGVWQQGLSGKAELNKAEYTRQVATLDAQAEVARAQGVAQANKIVAEGLGGPSGYLEYLWIEKVAGSSNQIIYMPSDGGIPLLEAGRLHPPVTINPTK